MNDFDLALRDRFLDPPTELYQAVDLLSRAADAILADEMDAANELIEAADMTEIRDYTDQMWRREIPDIHRFRKILGAPPRVERTGSRKPAMAVEREVFLRDGWRCRICGVPVISKKARYKIVERCPLTARWGDGIADQHFGLRALDSVLDHLLPFSRGGSHDCCNLIAACAPCNNARRERTLEEVGLTDPFLRDPVIDSWNGLTRLIEKKQL